MIGDPRKDKVFTRVPQQYFLSETLYACLE
jgi:hypothetical protein